MKKYNSLQTNKNTHGRAKKITVTLWEDKAEEFQLALSGIGNGHVFAVVTGLLAKKFNGKKSTPYYAQNW